MGHPLSLSIVVLFLFEGGFAAKADRFLIQTGVNLEDSLKGMGFEVDVEINHVFYDSRHHVSGEFYATLHGILEGIVVIDNHLIGKIL